MTVECRGNCGNKVTVEYQERRAPKSPILLITCRCKTCKLNNVTLAVLAIEDYYSRDLSDKMQINGN